MRHLIVGIIQGITEFLPVSSSGHLVVAEELLGINAPGITFEVILHVATLLAVILYFRKDIVKLFVKKRIVEHPLFYLFIGSIPAGIVGILFKDKVEVLFESVIYVRFFFILNSLILFSLFIFKDARERRIDFKSAFIIGIAQAFAILPGISRSGSTITMALLLGIKEEEAFSFSFLLSIPAILGALLLKAPEMKSTEISLYIIPFFAAMISGILALWILKKVMLRKKIQYFGVYTLCLGIVLFLVF